MERKISKDEKQWLCNALSKKPLQVLTQLEGFAVDGYDPVLEPDENGYAACGGEAEEFFNGPWDLRLFIKPELSRKDALGLLDKLRDWIVRYEAWPMFIDQQNYLEDTPPTHDLIERIDALKLDLLIFEVGADKAKWLAYFNIEETEELPKAQLAEAVDKLHDKTWVKLNKRESTLIS